MTQTTAVAILLLLAVPSPTHAPDNDDLPLEVQLRKDCPSDCACTLDVQGNVIVDCTDASWDRIPPEIPQHAMSFTLAGNFIATLNRASFSHLNLRSLHLLDLTKANITSIAADTFQDMPRLKKVLLDENDVSTEEIIAVLSKTKTYPGCFISVNGNARIDCAAVKKKSRKAICTDNSAPATSPATTTVQDSLHIPSTTPPSTAFTSTTNTTGNATTNATANATTNVTRNVTTNATTNVTIPERTDEDHNHTVSPGVQEVPGIGAVGWVAIGIVIGVVLTVGVLVIVLRVRASRNRERTQDNGEGAATRRGMLPGANRAADDDAEDDPNALGRSTAPLFSS